MGVFSYIRQKRAEMNEFKSNKREITLRQLRAEREKQESEAAQVKQIALERDKIKRAKEVKYEHSFLGRSQSFAQKVGKRIKARANAKGGTHPALMQSKGNNPFLGTGSPPAWLQGEKKKKMRKRKVTIYE